MLLDPIHRSPPPPPLLSTRPQPLSTLPSAGPPHCCLGPPGPSGGWNKKVMSCDQLLNLKFQLQFCLKIHLFTACHFCNVLGKTKKILMIMFWPICTNCSQYHRQVRCTTNLNVQILYKQLYSLSSLSVIKKAAILQKLPTCTLCLTIKLTSTIMTSWGSCSYSIPSSTAVSYSTTRHATVVAAAKLITCITMATSTVVDMTH